MLYKKRIPKKKRLTDPVSIIPFKGQAIEQQPTQKSDTSTDSTPSISEMLKLRQEAKKLTAPTGAQGKSYISINDLKSDILREESESQANEGPVTLDKKESTPFSVDELRAKWIQYANIAKQKNLDTLHSAMKSNDPSLGTNYEVQFQVSNEVQYNFIHTHLIEILTFLKEELKNYSITINLTIKQLKEEKTLYSGKEKYNDMIKRNPKLDILRDRFGLDLE